MDDHSSILFTPFELGGRTLKNRIAMAPLTRNRALHGGDVPQKLNAEYYAQRASAGLIISEATQISPTAKGYAWTPGIYSSEQVEGWKLVTNAVHAKGGTIYAQLWHVGRISHPSLQPERALPVAPSALIPEGQKTYIETGVFTAIGMPRALKLEEIPLIVEDYRKAAKNAISAGFDGVEVHAANGYLIQQFLSDGANYRTDQYGGSVSNRLRFALEVMEAVTAEIGGYRTGIRLSPIGAMNGISETSPNDIYFSLVRELSLLNLAYIHVIEGATQGPRDFNGFDFHALRKEFQGAWMVNNNYTRELAIEAIASGYADLVAFGRSFIANPDLVTRFKLNAPLNAFDRSTFYGGNEKGYTDYPTLS
ncbi:MAG: alkene reductase [Legionella sp.]|uniref:alkene reductase n=1 Tax=Legionella sp. TaxID=459 RepID=UPI0039E67D6F